MQHYGVSPPAVTERMLAYAHLRYLLYFVREAVVWLTLLLVLHCGWSARWRDLSARLSSKWPLQVIIYLALLAVALFVLRLPFNIYSGYFVEHQFGLSAQPFGSWFEDLLKGRFVELVTDSIGFVLAFAVMRKFPQRWPLVLWGTLTPVIAFAIFAYPLVVDPLFNHYEQMTPSRLRADITALASRAGIADAPVYVVDKSKQTTKLNAAVTGLGSSARVVIWDTTLRRMSPDELLSVIAHELGHYALGHIFVGFLLSVAGLFAVLQVAYQLSDRFLALLPARWGVKGLTDPAAIAALMLAGSVGGFLLSPLDSAISREIEHQADAFGLRLTGNRAAMARAFVRLSEENLADPDPPAFIRFWLYDHPTLRERIDFALGITTQ